MTIGNYGSMEISNKESLIFFLSTYFRLWHYRFNYNNYKKNIYPLLLNNKYSDNDTKAETDIDNLNIDSVILETKVDNNFILWELKTVKSHIKNINAYLKQGGYRGNFNLENKTHKDAFNKFLKTLNEFDTKTKGEVYLQEVINNSDENWHVFFLNLLLKDYLKIESFLIKKIQLDKPPANDKSKPVKSKRPEDNEWFKVGLEFAKGTFKYEPKTRPSFKQITIDAKLPETLRPYVSDTYQNRGSKNIFASKKKMTAIYNYCIENKINLSKWFIDEYNKITEND